MNFNSIKTQQKQNQHPSKPSNTRLTLDQVKLLETSFKSNPKLLAERKLELAGKLGLSSSQVAIWYQNRQAQHKAEAKELDYKTIQLKLNTVLVENRRFEKEVGVLKHELYKAQQILLALGEEDNGIGNGNIRPSPENPCPVSPHP